MALKFDCIGYWSEVKLDIIREYAHAYSTILSAQTKPPLYHVYIDAFAGAGVHQSKTRNEQIIGSPLIPLSTTPPFREYHLIDLDGDKVHNLHSLIGDRPDVCLYQGDCNGIMLEQVLPRVRYEQSRRGLCLLDPYGLHLNWEVIRAAGQLGTIDVFLNFPIADMNRNVFWHNPEGVDPADIARMNAFWGDESWRTAAYKKERTLFDEVDTKATNAAVATAFRQRLREVAGFANVPPPMPMRNSCGAVVYYLFFASQKPVAQNIVNDIFRKYGLRGCGVTTLLEEEARMFPPLHEWNAEQVLEAAKADESLTVEKKAKEKFDPQGDKKGTKQELAKQVCAFSNSGHGFLLYGVADAGELDAGVEEVGAGTQTSKAWVEQVIPTLLQPPAHGCQVRHIHVPGHHAPGPGVLVVEVPLSTFRPHWVQEGNKEVPYIRAGEHSSPISLQTFRDILSRGVAPEGAVRDLGVLKKHVKSDGKTFWQFNPIIEVVSGPACQLWSLELRVDVGEGYFKIASGHNALVPVSNVIIFSSSRPLFPRHRAPAGDVAAEFTGKGHVEVRTTLSVGSSEPAVHTFEFK